MLAIVPGLSPAELDPELVLVIVLPPLVMDGAWFTAHAPFRRPLAGITSLEIGAVLVTAVAVAPAAKLAVPISLERLAACLAPPSRCRTPFRHAPSCA